LTSPFFKLYTGAHEKQFVDTRKQKASELKIQIYALYLAYRDPRTPRYASVFTALVVGYAFSPIDLIPDFVPVLGYLDDLVLLPIGVIIVLRLIPTEIMMEYQARARDQNIAEIGEKSFPRDELIFWTSLFVLAAIYLGKRASLIRCE